MNNEIAKDLPLRLAADGKPALCLVTGATGYIGGRLVRELLLQGYRVRVMARNVDRLTSYPWFSQVEVAEGDANDEVAVGKALQGADVAYYLLHALHVLEDFERLEKEWATTFGKMAKQNNVKRIVYLGGMADSQSKLSAHLSSRAETGEILRKSGVPTVELRAGVVIGSGSASFEMLRYLTERIPVMVTPKWVTVRIQPIAVRDVLRYLVGAAGIKEEINDFFDIGGPEVLTYKELMMQYAEAAGLRKRIIMPLPVLTPRLSSAWVGLVTPVPITLARRLIDSLKNEVVCANDSIKKYIPDPKGGLITFKAAVALALTRIKEANVETRWSNAALQGGPSEPLPTDPTWAGGTLYTDVRTEVTKDPIDKVWQRIESIGGENGYSTATWAWELRGLQDRLVGGVGLRRGRRDPYFLIEGEALDFWRVEALDRPHLLRLRAEMKMPGLAWLEWTAESTPDGGTKVTQRALFVPKGLFGHIYWLTVLPMHGLVFPSMVKHIAHDTKIKRRK
jgi:uncharacterized protein YbjT (DUF2867 family)